MRGGDSVKLRLDAMFEKRPIWGLIVGLNVCILIWLISVQEPVMFDASTAALSSRTNYIESIERSVALQQGNNGLGRDLLAKYTYAQRSGYVGDMSVDSSSLATLNFSNNHNNNNIHNSTITFENSIFSKKNFVKTTLKPNDSSSDIESLGLGVGVSNMKTKPTPSLPTLTAVASALPIEDFNQLIDLHNFQFVISQPVCGDHIEALILIHSAPTNYDKRQVIRETWASISDHTAEFPLRVLFLLGAVSSEQMQDDLQFENNIHRDIIQGSFIDDYRNMTYKHIMAFKWFLYNCPMAQILMKVDDDVYVNTPQLMSYLKQHQQSQHNGINNTNNEKPTIGTSRTLNKNITTTNITSTSTATEFPSIFHKFNIFASDAPSTPAASSVPPFNASQHLFNHPQSLLFCQKIIGSLVKRSYRSKWRVSFKDYSKRYFPPYCPGYAIIYSPDIIFRLYTAAQNSKYFWIDDVHITGVLAQQTNSTITTSSHYILNSDKCDQILTGKTDLSKMEFLFAWQNISAQKIKLLWRLQMMSIRTLDNRHYKKATMNDEYEIEHQRHRSRNKHENFDDNKIVSSYTFISTNGFR